MVDHRWPAVRVRGLRLFSRVSVVIDINKRKWADLTEDQRKDRIGTRPDDGKTYAECAAERYLAWLPLSIHGKKEAIKYIKQEKQNEKS